MKLMIVAAIWPFFLSCSVGYAAGINILSEVHHLWGEGGAEYYLYPSVRYDVVSGETVGISVSGEYYNPDDSFPNPYASSASAGNFAIEVLAMYDSTANATSTYTFTTEYNFLTFAGLAYMQYVLPSSLSLSLYDLTNQTTLFHGDFTSFWGEEGWQEQFSWAAEFSVVPGNLYGLSMAAFASEGSMVGGGTSEWKGIRCNLSSHPQPVPEPATSCLFVLGMAVLACKRKLKDK